MKYSMTPPLLRRSTLERDNYTCRNCGRRGKGGLHSSDLQAHHIVSTTDGGEHVLENMLTLCTLCHNRTHAAKRGAGVRASYARHWK